MSNKFRRQFAGATQITQSLLDACQDNLLNGLEAIIEIESPDGSLIRASDRNKYVGEHFYEALTNFPAVKRTVGDWLGGGLVFSEIDLEISNVDGRFNKYLPGGSSFGTWVNRRVVLKIGLSDKAESYTTVFSGQITKEGGFSRSTKSISIKARNDFERLNASFPTKVFTQDDYLDADESLWGKPVPLVYGDWTVDVTSPFASLPALVTNGASIFVNNEQLKVDIVDDDGAALFVSKLHRLIDGDHVDLVTTNDSKEMEGQYYVTNATEDSFRLSQTIGGASIQVDGNAQDYSVQRPNHIPRQVVKALIADNAMTFLGDVYLFRQEYYYKLPTSIYLVNTDKNQIEISQNNTAFKINGANWVYNKSDQFFVLAKGKSLPSDGLSNMVAIAKDLLNTFGGGVIDYDLTWGSYLTKTQDYKARAYIDEASELMVYVIQLLEQVMLEPFVSRDLKMSLNSLRFSDWVYPPAKKLTNWDISKDSFQIKIDDKNNFNRGRGVYNYLPDVKENNFSTVYFKNQAAIDQSKDIADTKAVTYPNLHRREDVEFFFKETLKIASGFREVATVTVTSRLFLAEIGEMLSLYVDIGSFNLDGVPAMIRDISYNTSELTIELTLWVFTMIPFGSWKPDFYGTVGGSSAIIDQD